LGDIAAPGSNVDEQRSMFSSSWIVSDEKELMMMAAGQGTTIAVSLHRWIAEHFEEVAE